MPRVLILEDNAHYRRILTTIFSKLAPDAELVLVSTLEGYAQLEEKLLSFDLIIYDGRIGRSQKPSNTAPLARALKARGYSGIIVGLSSSGGCLDELKAAGCDYAFNKTRGIRAVERIIEILKEGRKK